jgi:hypothetical protein
MNRFASTLVQKSVTWTTGNAQVGHCKVRRHFRKDENPATLKSFAAARRGINFS